MGRHFMRKIRQKRDVWSRENSRGLISERNGYGGSVWAQENGKVLARAEGRWGLCGSYTVEAALVVSITFYVLTALLLCTFYVHDRAVIQSSVCETAAAGSSFCTSKERKSAMDQAKKLLSQSRLLGSTSLKGSISPGGKEAAASWSAVYPFPGFVMNYIAAGKVNIQKSWSSRVLDAAETIRKIRGAGELLMGDNT